MKTKKNIINLSSPEYAYRVVKVKHICCFSFVLSLKQKVARKFLLVLKGAAVDGILIFSSPGRSPGRAIALPPASALASASASASTFKLKFLRAYIFQTI